jgi:hypothetical protein
MFRIKPVVELRRESDAEGRGLRFRLAQLGTSQSSAQPRRQLCAYTQVQAIADNNGSVFRYAVT